MSAPTLDLPSTPANEWAARTTSALASADSGSFEPERVDTALKSQTVEQPESRHPAIPHFASTSSTPGPNFPGSFPKETEDHVTSGGPEISLDQAKQTVVENVTGILETAKQYLPEAVTSYFPSSGPNAQATEIVSKTSLPSSEVHGDTSGKSGGVGSLPGNVNEEAVAKLPEERALDGTIGETTEVGNDNQHPAILTTTNTQASTALPDDLLHPTAQINSTQANDSSTDSETARTADSFVVNNHPTTEPTSQSNSTQTQTPPSNEKLAAARNDSAQEKEPGSSVPETETAAKVLGAGGVGDLPGSKSESAVALLPDEREAPEGLATGKEHRADPSASALSSDKASESKPVPTPSHTTDTQASDNSKVNTVGRAPDSVFSTTAVAGHTPLSTPLDDAAPSPHVGHSKSKETSSTSAASSNTLPTTTASDGIAKTKSRTDTVSTDQGSAGSSPRKSGFMTKLKGEVKVLSGKLGKNEEKIEEGKRLLGKS